MNVELLQKGLEAFKADPNADLNSWCDCIGGHILKVAGFNVNQSGFVVPDYFEYYTSLQHATYNIAQLLEIHISDAQTLCEGEIYREIDHKLVASLRVKDLIAKYPTQVPPLHPEITESDMVNLSYRFAVGLQIIHMTVEIKDPGTWAPISPPPYVGELVGV